MGKTTKTFGQRLKALRTAKGKSLNDASRDLDIAYMTLWRYEAGHNTNPSLDTLRKLSAYYGTTLDSIAGEAAA